MLTTCLTPRPPTSSSAVAITKTGRFKRDASHWAAATMVAASGPFISQLPRPMIRPSFTVEEKASQSCSWPGTVSVWEKNASPPVPSPFLPTMFAFFSPFSSTYSSRSVSNPFWTMRSSTRAEISRLLQRLTDLISTSS